GQSVARMLRVTRQGAVEQIGEFPRIVRSQITLTSTDWDELLFTFSRPDASAHAVLVVEVDERGELQPRVWREGSGRVVGLPHLPAHWLPLALHVGTNIRFEDVARADLRPMASFRRGGWW